MTLAIRELERLARSERPDVDAFLHAHRFPIVEGRQVTFVWIGRANSVLLRHWIFGLPTAQAFERLIGTDLWFLVMELPEKSRVEYKFEIDRGGMKQLVADPLNADLAHDPYGANSVVHGAGHRSPDWTQPDTEARVGTVEELAMQSDVFGDRRPFSLYLPARFRPTRRYPLLVVHDGPDYLRFAGLKTVLDNLIHRLEIQSMIVACIPSANRMIEYADDPRHAEFLVRELVPLLESRYPLIPEPSARGLMGASFGGVASLSTAWRHPGFFDRLLLQSGSFAFTDIGHHDRGPHFDRVVEFVNAFRERPGRPAEQIYMSCGTYESLIYYNRSLVPLLQSTGMSVRFTEVRDGHNWENWRDRLREGLSWLFPGPLWMVYE